jgi:1,3-beta-glucanosyltransferase GAS1
VIYSGGSFFDVLANPSQCTLDAALLRELGANTISVPFVDLTLSHDGCMSVFEDAGIYVIVNMAGDATLVSGAICSVAMY